MKGKEELLFEINGFKVYNNRVYYVKDKVDYDAPSGFQKAGVTKLPHDGVTDSVTIRFKATDSQGKEGVWDTGFYAASPIFRNMSTAQAEVIAKSNRKNVADPYIQHTSIRGDSLSHASSNDWWDGKIIRLYSGRTFSTAKPDERFELYCALLADKLTPEGQQGNTKFKSSSYLVIDIAQNKKRRDEIADMEFEAIGNFMGLLKTDKPGLLKLLDYVGLTVSESVTESTLRTMFKDFIGNSESKMKLYLRMAEEFSEEEGRAKVDIYQALKRRYPNKGVTKSRTGEFLYDGVEIGGDLKTAAQNIASRSEYADIKDALILGED